MYIYIYIYIFAKPLRTSTSTSSAELYAMHTWGVAAAWTCIINNTINKFKATYAEFKQHYKHYEQLMDLLYKQHYKQLYMDL